MRSTLRCTRSQNPISSSFLPKVVWYFSRICCKWSFLRLGGLPNVYCANKFFNIFPRKSIRLCFPQENLVFFNSYRWLKGQEIAVIGALGLRYASLSPKLATCIGARPLLLPMLRAQVFTNVSKTIEPRIPGIFFFLSLTGVDIGSFTTRKLKHLKVLDSTFSVSST